MAARGTGPPSESEDASPGRPVRILYLLVEHGGKTYFNRHGVAFVNRDDSLTVKMDLFPELTFQIRERQER